MNVLDEKPITSVITTNERLQEIHKKKNSNFDSMIIRDRNLGINYSLIKSLESEELKYLSKRKQ